MIAGGNPESAKKNDTERLALLRAAVQNNPQNDWALTGKLEQKWALLIYPSLFGFAPGDLSEYLIRQSCPPKILLGATKYSYSTTMGLRKKPPNNSSLKWKSSLCASINFLGSSPKMLIRLSGHPS